MSAPLKGVYAIAVAQGGWPMSSLAAHGCKHDVTGEQSERIDRGLVEHCGKCGAHLVSPATVARLSAFAGGREAATSEVQASETKSAGGDTPTIRAALESARERAIRGSFATDVLRFRDALESLDRLAARLETGERDQARAREWLDAHFVNHDDDPADYDFPELLERLFAFGDQGWGEAGRAEAELGAARERISELEAEAGGHGSAVSSELPSAPERRLEILRQRAGDGSTDYTITLNQSDLALLFSLRELPC